VQYLTNALDTTTRGFDLVINQEADLLGGKARFTGAFNRNYLHEDRERNPSILSGTVLVPLEYGSPTTKLVLTGDWSSERWGAHVAATRFGTLYAFSFDTNLPTINGSHVQRYGSEWSIDLEGRVNIVSNVTLAIGGTDVFNRYPDQTTAGSNFGGAFPYNFAPALGLNGAYYYANLSVSFGH